MAASVKQYRRACQLIVGTDGNGLLISDLRVKFEIVKTVKSAPNTAIIRIYNLNPNNEALIKNEYDEVILNAGYEGNIQLLFRGNIKRTFHYRETNDRITQIECGDGDDDFANATMNETIAAGTTTSQLIDRAVSSFANIGGTQKGIIQISDSSRLRGKVLTGMTRDILSNIAQEQGVNWSIQDGNLQMVGTNSLLPNEAIVISSDTGLLYSPEINDKGVGVRCLLNPLIAINAAVKLDNSNIKLKTRRQTALGSVRDQGETVALDPNGIYKVIKVIHRGDTRGTGASWMTEATCIALGQPIPDTSLF